MDKNACNTLRTREAYYYLKENNELDLNKKYLLKEIKREDFFRKIPDEILDKVIESEISDETLNNIFEKIDKLIGNEEVNLIIGGPPCQSFSPAGIARDPNRMLFDPRNYLYLYYIEFLKRYRPNFFVFENVKGIIDRKSTRLN